MGQSDMSKTKLADQAIFVIISKFFERISTLALAMILIRFSGITYYLLARKNILKVDIKGVFPWKVLLKEFALAFACGWLIYSLTTYEASGLGKLLLVGSAYAVIYIGFLKLLKMLTPRGEEIIKRWVTLKAVFGRA